MTTFEHMKGIEEIKQGWFTIPDRPRARADKNLIGTFWKVKQEIARVGYLWGPMDFDLYDVEEKAKEMMAADVFSTMLMWDNRDKASERAKIIVNSLVEKFGYKIVPAYKARGQLMFEKSGRNPERAIWYMKTDVIGQGFNYFMVTGTRRCVTGTYYPASTSGSYWDDYEYDPAYIGNAVHHNIFTGLMFCDFGGPARFDREHFETWGRAAMMHPMDLVEQVMEE